MKKSGPIAIENMIMIKIIPLSKKHLDEAITLVEMIFPYKEDQKIARINFIECLSLKKSGKSYWVAASETGKIIGLTGLYLDLKDKKTIWLGWFGVHPEYRRQGIGSLLFQFAIKEAKRRDFKTLKIYTSSDKSEQVAHKLYEWFGFIRTEAGQDKEVIYYTKEITHDLYV